MFDEGNYIKCIDLINAKEQEQGKHETSFEGSLLYLKSMSYTYLGDFEKGIQYADSCFDISEKIKDNFLKIKAYLAKGTVVFYLGKYQESLDLVYKTNKLFEKNEFAYNFDYHTLKGRMYNLWGLIVSKDDLQGSTKIHEKALHHRKLAEHKNGIGSSIANIGNNYNNLGILDKAIEFFLMALDIFQELSHKRHVGGILNNIGNTLQKKGELDEALDYYEQSLTFVDNPLDISMLNHNIGVVLHQIGDYDVAMKHTLVGYKIRKEIQNPYLLSFSLIGLIHILVDSGQGDSNAVMNYLDEFKELSETSNEPGVDVRYKFTRALYLKSQNTLKAKSQAMELIEDVLENDLFSDFQITIQAMVYKCELLLLELRVTKEDTTLEKVRSLANKLKTLGEEQNLYPLVVESGILEAKLAILQNKLSDARELLDYGLIISEKYNLGVLRQRIFKERELIERTAQSWTENITISENLNQRMDDIGILKAKTRLNKFIISPNRLAILLALTKKDGLTFTELKDLTEFSSTKLSKQLKNLLEKDYIQKKTIFIDAKPTKTYFATPLSLNELKRHELYIENYAEIPLLLRNYIHFN